MPVSSLASRSAVYTGPCVAGVGRAAGERGLACVVAQRRRTHGDQQVGVVGQTVGRWPRGGPENSTSTAASRPGFAEAVRRCSLGGAPSPRPARRRAPGAGRRAVTWWALSTSGFSQAGAASGVSSSPSLPELTPALLSRGSTAAAISSALANDRGRISATLPSGRSTTVAGITLGTLSAAATSRRPSCSVGSRTPSSASRNNAAVSFSS